MSEQEGTGAKPDRRFWSGVTAREAIGWVFGLASLLVGLVMPLRTMNQQERLKKYEVTYLEKTKRYTAFQQAMYAMTGIAQRSFGKKSVPESYLSDAAFVDAARAFDLATLDLEPFFDSPARTRHRLYRRILAWDAFSLYEAPNHPEKQRLFIGYEPKREDFGDFVFFELFKDSLELAEPTLRSLPLTPSPVPTVPKLILPPPPVLTPGRKE